MEKASCVGYLEGIECIERSAEEVKRSVRGSFELSWCSLLTRSAHVSGAVPGIVDGL